MLTGRSGGEAGQLGVLRLAVHLQPAAGQQPGQPVVRWVAWAGGPVVPARAGAAGMLGLWSARYDWPSWKTNMTLILQ